MRGRGAVTAVVVMAWLGLVAERGALAEPAPAASKAESAATAQAKQLYLDGVKEVNKGQWAKAHALFLEAYRLKKHFQIALNLAQTELKLGLYKDAAEHVASFLKEAQDVAESERRTATAMLEEAKKHIGTLHVEVDTAGAEVSVDGAAVGRAPLGREVFVEPGRRVIEARGEREREAREVRTVAEGEQVRVRLRVRKGEEEQAAARVGTSEAVAGGVTGGVNKTVVLIGGVATGVAAVVGVGFTIGAGIKFYERGDKPTDCRDRGACLIYNDAEIERANLSIVAVTGYVAASLLGAGTLTYVLVKRTQEPPTTARADLMMGPRTAGAMVTMHW